MPKLTEQEREKRRKRVQKQAVEAVAERGQFNFRLDGDDIKRLYALAGNRKRPVSAMVREWVLERLGNEESNTPLAPPWAQALEQRLTHTEVYILALALSSLSGKTKAHETLKQKLRNHIRRHLDLEADDELRSLLA